MQHTIDIPTPHNQESDAVVKFISSLRHHTDNIAVNYDDPIILHPYQEEITRRFFGTLDEKGRRKFKTLYLTIGGKNGKALALDTPLPTPTGWTTMGEVQVGDQLIDENGLPCNVTFTTDVMHNHTCYEVVFSDGCTITADAEHLWVTRSANRHGIVDTVTTQAIADSIHSKHKTRKEYNHSITVAEPRSKSRQIVAANQVDSVPVKCITVDSPSHLYLAGESCIPTHNTVYSSLLLVYYLLNVKRNQTIISIASSIKQASLLFKQAVGILKQNGYIDDGTVLVSEFHKTITNKKNGNKYEVLAPKPQTIDGIEASMICMDELHRIAHAPEIWAIVAKAMVNQPEPILIVTTTAGYGQNSFCFQKYQEAKQIIEGDLEVPSVLPYVYEVPIDEDIYDEKNWPMANPALIGENPFLSIDLLRTAAESAKKNPVDELMFRRFHCNQFADAELSWINPVLWDECKQPFSEKELEGSIAYGGIDYAPINDLSAFVLAVPKNGNLYIVCRAWLPESDINAKCDRDGIDYLKWVQSGHLKLTKGDTTSLSVITEDILEMCQKYQVQSIAADPFNTVELIQRLNDHNITTFANPNTHALMNYPCQQTMKAILEKRLVHDGNPLLRFCAVNTVVHMDHGQRIKPDKMASREKKTDAMIATILAIGRAATTADKGLDPTTYFKQKLVWV